MDKLCQVTEHITQGGRGGVLTAAIAVTLWLQTAQLGLGSGRCDLQKEMTAKIGPRLLKPRGVQC